jgi:excisionase family DNA binding protein
MTMLLEVFVKTVLDKEVFLTGEEVASCLNISHRTLYRWHRQRRGPPQIKIGRHKYYRRAALESWLLKQEEAFDGDR